MDRSVCTERDKYTPSLPLVNHVWGKWLLGCVKMYDAGRRDNTAEKIKNKKKPGITKTLNISLRREITDWKKEEDWVEKRLVLTVSAPWEVIRGTLLESQLSTWTTPLFLVTRGKFRMINCYVRQICYGGLASLFSAATIKKKKRKYPSRPVVTYCSGAGVQFSTSRAFI